MVKDKDDTRASGSDKPDNEASEPEATEEEAEYEIEKILDAKRGMFPDGRMGYFVKWKGYGDEDNSWVDQQDAGNAEELIEEYWSKNGRSRKGMPKSKRGNVSTVGREEESDTASASVSTKKRGRKTIPRSTSVDDEGHSEVGEPRTSKKPRKNMRESDVVMEDDETMIIGNMSKYMSVPSWEELVATVDTIEQLDSGENVIYFTLKSGEKIRETSKLCKSRFPQKLLNFFESHLRWKEVEADDN
ncbi:hypothetical protein AMATHDRAFT_59907 [Amanita thiersii Skay4041]|uniref:Chromo domain-containing protein n=1 Tax=Amanita thiersii Skay4041 TaxID=703135 RepID=A0A2A9NTA8_9AGAR|nr:hypothetical protein AMATHDRAFT_59907 [Amanita thiersii Skay4041]